MLRPLVVASLGLSQLGCGRAADADPTSRRGVAAPSRATGADSPIAVCDDASRLCASFRMIGVRPVLGETNDAGETNFWDALGEGIDLMVRRRGTAIEDFVRFERAPRVAEIAYDIDVSNAAGVRLAGSVLELLDSEGTPRLRAGPAYIRGADGTVADAELALVGCAHDRDPRAPYGRPVVAPGASRCTLYVRWDRHAVPYPAVLDPPWAPTASTSVPRVDHTATLLPSGRVLVTGGTTRHTGSQTTLGSAEVYDPETGTWAATDDMASLRAGHTATRLADGRVLIAGAWSAVSPVTAELYDEETGTFEPTGDLVRPRLKHTATLLADGRVLIAGGDGETAPLADCEIYDPASGSFTRTESLHMPRVEHAACLLADGSVLVTGGRFFVDDSAMATTRVERYTVSTGTWEFAAPLEHGRHAHTSTTLAGGSVVVAGGARASDSTEVYLPERNEWVEGPELTGTHEYHEAVLLDGDGVLIVSGWEFSPTTTMTTRLFDAPRWRWLSVGSLERGRRGHTATLLADGRVLVVGGDYLDSSVELLSLAARNEACTSDGECETRSCEDAGAMGVCGDPPAPVDAGIPAPLDAGAEDNDGGVPDDAGSNGDATTEDASSDEEKLDDRGGCGCRMANRSPPPRFGWIVVALGLALLLGRRRSRSGGRYAR